MSEARIVERTGVSGGVTYVIQQKHYIFRWRWVDAWENSSLGAVCQDTFSTLEEARLHLSYFDGSKPVYRVIDTDQEDDNASRK